MDAALTSDDAGIDAAIATDDASEGDAGSTAIEDALEAAGFVVADGRFAPVDLHDCCAPMRSCAGNNPSSPYMTIEVPRGPDQTVPNENETADGLANTFRLREDEAIVIVGTTPPPAAYFGFTPYLMARDDGGGMRRSVFASLSETLNNGVIGVDGTSGAFSQPFAIIVTSDAFTDGEIRAALASAGIAARGTNTLPLDSTIVHFGLDAPADTVGVLFRVAIFESATEGAAWLDAPPVSVWRVSPATVATPDPLPPPAARPKDTTNTETALAPAVDRLEAAIRAASTGHVIRDLPVDDGVPDPVACYEGTAVCAGDNRDTVYPATGLFRLDAGDVLYVFGIDHASTGKATYASASLYALEHLVGLRAVTDREWAGSAAELLPDDPDLDHLFMWRFARDCTGLAHCTELSTDACPDGAALDAFLSIAFRAYLEPTSSTGPDSATLVRERVLLVNGR